MKKSVENILKKYWYYIILFFITFILLIISGYDSNKSETIYFMENKLDIENGLYVKDNTYYISYEDIKANFDENVFYDKISKKLIITTWDNVVKIDKDNEQTIRYEEKLWYNIEYLADLFDLDVLKSDNCIYILNHNYIEAKINSYRVEIYDITKNDVINIITKDYDVKIIEDENIKADTRWLNIVANKDNKLVVGRVLKEKLEYNYEKQEEILEENLKQIIVYMQDTLSQNTDITKVTGLSQNLLRLIGDDKVTKKDVYRPNGYTKDVYAVFTNGYKYSNFDTDVLTYMLNSDENKEKTIKEIIDFVNTNKLNGIVLDFKKFKLSDKEMLTEYIKELGANLHRESKMLYVNIENVTSINIKKIEKFVDYIIVEAYGERTLYSKTFGAYSSVLFVDNMINSILDLGINTKKLILEISPNSILFTIRAGTIIDTEFYNMNAVSEYIRLNDLEILTDEVNKMHYIDFKRGITSYKMWIEDENSIEEKLNIIIKNNMSGISIYKSGDELKSIYDIIIKKIEVAK